MMYMYMYMYYSYMYRYEQNDLPRTRLVLCTYDGLCMCKLGHCAWAGGLAMTAEQ